VGAALCGELPSWPLRCPLAPGRGGGVIVFDGACPAHSRGQGHGLYGGPEEKTKPDAPKVSERFGNPLENDEA